MSRATLNRAHLAKPHYRPSFMPNDYWHAERHYALYDQKNGRWMESKAEWRGRAPEWVVPVAVIE